MEPDKRMLLLYRQLSGQSTIIEKKVAEKIERTTEYMASEKDITRIWKMSESYRQDYEPDVEKGLAQLKAKMAAPQTTGARQRVLSKSWMRLAAVLLLFIAMALLLRNILAKQDENMVYQTNAAEEKELTLSDGSTIVLNENANLLIPNNFDKAATRTVVLSGEAYFDIATNAKRPFVIRTAQSTITVIGTAFNVRAYPAENFTEVEVAEGLVHFAAGEQQIELTATEKGFFSDSKGLIKKDAKDLNAQSWRTKSLKFRRTPVVDVLQALERYYKIKVELKNTAIENCKFVGDFNNTQLSTILKTLAETYQVEVKEIAQNQYLIEGGNCPK